MKLVLQLLTVCALAWTCEAGVIAHPPQTLQNATNFFDWLSRLNGDGSSKTTQSNTEIKYNDNVVTKCPPNIIFVLDGSDSVSPIGFQYAKRALNREIKAVTEAFANADVGVILFSDVTEEIPLKSRSAQEIDDLIKQVDALKQPRRKTSIPNALRRARQNLLDYSVIEGRALNGERSGNIIVLLSDGNPDNQRATIQEAKISKDHEMLIISLSLEDALLELLKDISHIVQEYRTAIDWVSLIACPSRILPDVPKGSGCRDVLLVVDGSDSVLRRKEIVRQYLAYTALRYRKATNAVGVNIYGSDPSIQASNTRLRLMEDKYVLADSIRLKLMFPKTGGTGTDLAVLQSVGMLDDDIRNRPATLVLITDGPPFDVTATREAIRSARSRGYHIIIIRVGTAMTDAVLSEISGGTQENVFSVNTFTDLFFVNFDSALCSNISEPDKCQITASSCRYPEVLNSTNSPCACVCPIQCPNATARSTGVCLETGTTYDPITNRCDPRCSNTCPKGQKPDFNNFCACQCTNVCPPEQFADPSRGCSCKCLNVCSINQSPDVNNRCQCTCNVCPVGQRPDVNNDCNCVCNNTCPSGQFASTVNGCQCQCSNTCPNGQIASVAEKCLCPEICPNTCLSGQTPNITNKCICSCTNTCPPNQRPNPNNNCICEQICQRSCPSGTFQNFDCSCNCPHGTSYNQTTSQCVDVVTYHQCTRAEYPCENNQVAYKDCNGSCFCVCGSGFAGTRCEIKVQAELCDNCFYDNGHYHAGVVGYCDLFVNCLPVGEVPKDSQTRPASFSPIIMSCAPGTFYITRPNGWRGCDFLANGICSTDQCQTLPANARYADSTSCQSYWQCGSNRQLVSKGCCDAGQAFDPMSQSCIRNATCQVTCGPQVARSCNNSTAQPPEPGCPFEVTANDPNEFFYKVVPWAKSRCLPTDVMDLNLCRCVAGNDPKTRVSGCDPVINYNFDTASTNDEDRIPRIQISGVGQVANFSGSEDLTLKYFAGSGFHTDNFQINLRLFLPRQPTGSGRIAVVTNADCDVKESVSITMDNRNFYFKIFQLDSNVPVEIVIPYSGLADRNGWYDLTLIYKRINKKTFEFTGKVGSNTQTYQGTVPLTAIIDSRTCALHLGYGFNYTSLVGYVDDFQVWRCDPNARVIV